MNIKLIKDKICQLGKDFGLMCDATDDYIRFSSAKGINIYFDLETKEIRFFKREYAKGIFGLNYKYLSLVNKVVELLEWEKENE